jgi:hypothetical protein
MIITGVICVVVMNASLSLHEDNVNRVILFRRKELKKEFHRMAIVSRHYDGVRVKNIWMESRMSRDWKYSYL